MPENLKMNRWERAHAVSLNKLRMDLFTDFINKGKELRIIEETAGGKLVEKDPNYLNSIGRFINATTDCPLFLKLLHIGKIRASDRVFEDDSGITFLRDSQWSAIDGEACRVISFCPLLSSIKGGKVLAPKTIPYASVTLECKKIPKKITGFISHKMDFLHLWLAFKERTIKPEEEVIILWSIKHYKNKLYKILSFMMPRLWVMVCPKGAFELMVDHSYKPELSGEVRWNAQKPIIDWKPEVMK